MPARRSLILALACLLLLPAGARASDPLLSGYAGPGSGEQVVLGGTTVGGGAGGSTPSAAAATAERSLRATTPASGTSPASATGLSRKPQRKKPSSSTSQQKTDDGSTTSGAATPARAPAVVAYPTRDDGDVTGLPVSAGALLLVVLGLGVLVLAGLGLRRLSAPDHRPPGPQVSAS